jgi:hypothetical protein
MQQCERYLPLKNSSKCIFLAENTSGGIFNKDPVSAGVTPALVRVAFDIPLT